MARLSAIQLCSTPNIEENLAAIERQLKRLPQADDHLVVLPECCLFFGSNDKAQLTLATESHDQSAHQKNSNKLILALSLLAVEYHVYLVAGTIPLATMSGEKFTNTSCIFSPQGELLGQYDKIHLFDVNVNDNSKSYRESTYTQQGKKIVVVNTSFAKIGLSVCYDVRFPALFSQLRQAGADIITVPSAFTRVTGEAHWQSLLQARAIENQVYIIASAQEGVHANGRETWGHSMIICPWGEILALIEENEGSVTTDFSRQALTKVRDNMPVLTHNQFKTELISYE